MYEIWMHKLNCWNGRKFFTKTMNIFLVFLTSLPYISFVLPLATQILLSPHVDTAGKRVGNHLEFAIWDPVRSSTADENYTLKIQYIPAVYLANNSEQLDMGGDHAHGHDPGHHHGIKVPDYRQYKVENAPELVTLRNLLAQKGLSDPWIRNEVWRYNPKEFGTLGERWRLAGFRGFKWGLLAFIATITIEKGLELVNPPAKNHHGSSHH